MHGVKRAHFIGIGGVGMSAVAKLLKDAGVEVTGSDESVYSPVSDFLKQSGLIYQSTYRAENIPPDADLIVIGKNAKLVAESNPEVVAALASGVRIASFPEVLAELAEGKKVILVAGSYGKSSCTALLAHCLLHAGLEPSYFIGASPLTPSAPAHFGKGEYFVIEGDEYPSSNTDPRAKFLHFKPVHALVTPLAHDHFNVFPTPESYLKPFQELVPLIEEGLVVANSGTLSDAFLSSIDRPIVIYGAGGEFSAAEIAWGERTSFNLFQGDTLKIRLETGLLGEHNIENIVGVAALALSEHLLTVEQLKAGVETFRGVRRRLDRKSDKTSIPIFEGFGSSREKLQSAIAAMRLHFPSRRLLVVFEPHTFSWRRREALPWYDTAFAGASGVYIFEPPQDGKEATLSLEEMTARITSAGISAHGVSKPAEMLEILEKDLQKNDCVLISSSGAMGGLIESIPQLAERLFPA